MGFFKSNYFKWLIALILIFPAMLNCSKSCKNFKKNVSVSKLLTTCQLAVKNNAEICGDLTVAGKINGLASLVGPQGPVGPAGGLAAYGYIYTTARQEVLVGAPVYFTNDAYLLGITHPANSQNIIVDNTGLYVVLFSLSPAVGSTQFSIAVNGVASPSTVYGNFSGQNNGQCILSLAAGDIVTLINNDSGQIEVLPDGGGGGIIDANVHASVIILKIA